MYSVGSKFESHKSRSTARFGHPRFLQTVTPGMTKFVEDLHIWGGSHRADRDSTGDGVIC